MQGAARHACASCRPLLLPPRRRKPIVRAEHDAFISREREDIAEQRKRLAKKEAELLGQEGNLEQVRENYRQRQAVLDRQLGRSLELVSPEDSGLTREFGGREHESPAPADPH